MKEVLLIDLNDGFRDFMVDQLTKQQVNVVTAYGDRDSFSKILTGNPSLIIIEAQLGLEVLQDFFKQKLMDPNARSIPMIICGPIVDQKKIVTLTQFGVIKYFTKPIKYDIFLQEIGKALKQSFNIDDTKCSIELHVSNDILFIEIANGLNLEKIEILKYKISDVIGENLIKVPKVILMLTNLDLTFMDATNLEFLFDSILDEPRILKRNFKILSYNSFVKSLVRGQEKYEDITVTGDISRILKVFMADQDVSNVPEAVSSTLLTHSGNARVGDFSMHFYSEVQSLKKDNSEPDNPLRIAIVDNDINSCRLLYRTLNAINAETTVFLSGRNFMSKIKEGMYSAIILELAINDVNGFELLQYLNRNRITTPVIIYSSVTRKDYIANTIALGVKSYLIKPQRADVITTKIMDLVDG